MSGGQFFGLDRSVMPTGIVDPSALTEATARAIRAMRPRAERRRYELARRQGRLMTIGRTESGNHVLQVLLDSDGFGRLVSGWGRADP